MPQVSKLTPRILVEQAALIAALYSPTLAAYLLLSLAGTSNFPTTGSAYSRFNSGGVDLALSILDIETNSLLYGSAGNDDPVVRLKMCVCVCMRMCHECGMFVCLLRHASVLVFLNLRSLSAVFPHLGSHRVDRCQNQFNCHIRQVPAADLIGSASETLHATRLSY